MNDRELCGDSHDETEEKNCNEKNNCGHWSNWSEWIDSSDVQQSRQRACLHAKIGEPTCFGPSTMSRQVSPWTGWKFTPEVSKIYRQREICDETGCKENNFIQRDEKDCENTTCPGWSKWGPWKSLAPSKPVYKRERICENQHEFDLKCIGSSQSVKNCTDSATGCGFWGPWSSWMPISKDEEIIDDQLSGVMATNTPRNSPVINIFLENESSGDSEIEEISIFNPFSSPDQKENPPVLEILKEYRRNRKCVGGEKDFPACFGPDEEFKSCQESECPKLGDWSEWAYEPASRTLRRLRSCTNDEILPCTENLTEDIECDDSCPFWSDWTDWTEWKCSEKCEKVRSRECTVIRDGERLLSSDCVGDDREKIISHCDCAQSWSEWSKWTEFENSISRKRHCSIPSKDCDILDTQTLPCSENGCPIWSNWTPWTAANTTHLERTRICTNQILEFQNICDGVGFETKLRPLSSLQTLDPLTISPLEKWGDWSEWAVSDQSYWVYERSRLCILENCAEFQKESRDCKINKCAYLTLWTELFRNETTIVFTRDCINPSDNDMCKGDTMKTESLSSGSRAQRRLPSQITSDWSEWEVTLECSATCGDGKRFLSRKCLSDNCSGDSLRIELCTTGLECPFWKEWSQWTECSASCGVAEKSRTRKCSFSEGGCKARVLFYYALCVFN